MGVLDVVVAGVVLAMTVAVGTVAHEFAHALALRAFRIPFDVEWLPARTTAGTFTAGVVGNWASVTPRVGAPTVVPWRLRVAALMPFALALPFVAILVGLVADPLAGGDPVAIAVVTGWLACSLPSPQDFSVFWHAERALHDDGERSG